jgi:hypothetical protein
MRNDNKNDYNAIGRNSKNSCYGTTGKVILMPINLYWIAIMGKSGRIPVW